MNLDFTKEEVGILSQSLGYSMMYAKTEKETAEFALLKMKIDEVFFEKPFISAKFGDNWKNFALQNFSKEDIAEIAFNKGRDNIRLQKLLENELMKS